METQWPCLFADFGKLLFHKKNLFCFPRCGNFRIFLSLRFYVKSILQILEVSKLPFFAVSAFKKYKKCKNASINIKI